MYVYVVGLDWFDAYDKLLGIFSSAQDTLDALPSILRERRGDKKSLLIHRYELDNPKADAALILSDNYKEVLEVWAKEEKEENNNG